MASLNKALVIGRLGDDPEVRQTQTGTTVANFSIATDESYTDSQGQEVEQTEWHDVVAFGRLAEVCEQYLSKGSRVYVEGPLQTSTWETDAGETRSSTEIKALTVQFLDGRGEGGGPAQQRDPAPEPTSQQPSNARQDGGGGEAFEPDDQLPF